MVQEEVEHYNLGVNIRSGSLVAVTLRAAGRIEACDGRWICSQAYVDEDWDDVRGWYRWHGDLSEIDSCWTKDEVVFDVLTDSGWCCAASMRPYKLWQEKWFLDFIEGAFAIYRRRPNIQTYFHNFAFQIVQVQECALVLVLCGQNGKYESVNAGERLPHYFSPYKQII
jgi:hypothetical protein